MDSAQLHKVSWAWFKCFVQKLVLWIAKEAKTFVCTKQNNAIWLPMIIYKKRLTYNVHSWILWHGKFISYISGIVGWLLRLFLLTFFWIVSMFGSRDITFCWIPAMLAVMMFCVFFCCVFCRSFYSCFLQIVKYL